MAEENEYLNQKLGQLPRRPGVYLMKDSKGKVLYVGKAVDLRQRVRSYFQQGSKLSPKVRALTEKIKDLDFTVTDSEVEALILENNLIKEYKPRYNINLKDDKQYPYLRLTVQENFPRLHTTRRVERDGARYFGPFANAGAVRETVNLIRRLFHLRHCRGPIVPERNRRPCLNRHIGRCLAPCSGEVTVEEYRRAVEEVLLFLEGRKDKLLSTLRTRMSEASAAMEYEKAARLRDQYRAVESVGEKQKITVVDGGDRDVLAMAAGSDYACVQLFAIRSGRVTGRDHFLVTNPTGEANAEVMAAFMRQYYSHAADIPKEVLLCCEIPDSALLEEWLTIRRGHKVKILVPQRGEKKELVRLAGDNARLFLAQEELRLRERDPMLALSELAECLGLDEPPLRIEGYDVSHLHGEGTVAAMVVFEQGRALPADYRRFRIKTVDKPDDYASVREAVARRFKRLSDSHREGESPENSKNPFNYVPDLILIDGGAGQLSAACHALSEAGFGNLPVISLAKEHELIFMPGSKEPLRLAAASPALQLLQRVRDEAHRFVITYQRTLRRQPSRGSILLAVPGVGDSRRKALLKHFGSLGAMRKASIEELAAVKGMNKEIASRLYEYLHTEQ